MGSRSGEVRLLWGEKEQSFRLTVLAWEKVQEAAKAGPPEIARRLAMAALGHGKLKPLQIAAAGRLGQWNVQDIRAVLLHGLIGAGTAHEDAERLCRELVDERPWMLNLPVALEVVMASLFGPDEEPALGEPPGSAT